MTTVNNETTATVQPQGFATQPRALVLIDGIQVNVTSIQINTAQFGYADTYHIDMPLNSQTVPINRAYFATNQTVMVQIYVGYPPNPSSFTTTDLDLVLIGTSDEYDDDLCSDMISISGRDLTSKFIDEKIIQKFPNQTSSQIVTMFANQQGLTPQVTATSTPVGNFYATQQTLLANQTSQWDLITYLSQQEGFVAFVQGRTLVFEPRPTTNVTPYPFTYQPASSANASPIGNFTRMRVHTNSVISGNTQVTVRVPYSTKTGQAFSTTVRTKNTKSKGPANRKYVYKKSGLSPQQAQQLATQLLSQHTSQGVGIDFQLPGDNLLKKDSVIELKGTNTAYDQLYFPDQVTREISLSPASYRMYGYARNKATDVEMQQ